MFYPKLFTVQLCIHFGYQILVLVLVCFNIRATRPLQAADSLREAKTDHKNYNRVLLILQLVFIEQFIES